MSPSNKVQVKQGTVIGGQRNLPNGDLYYYFQGIPYAVPPLGKLRFKAPVPLERFSTPEITCTKEGNVPLQNDGFTGKLIGSEDCLFLNVYTPKTNGDALLPVMVYIHGGGFVVGSGNTNFHNPLYLIQEQVIVVTLNYRLGVLGFLSLPEGNIPGNAALKDQRLALQWVKENISQFHGDPNNVTLFGESCGGVFAHLHVLSQGSKNLFHKVITQSGLGTMPWAIENNASEKTIQLAKSLGCSSGEPLEIAEFLQKFSNMEEFIKRARGPIEVDDTFTARSIPLRPVIENESPEAVVTRPPLESMNTANSIEIPMIIGYNSAEALAALPSAILNIEEYNDLRKCIPINVNLKPEDPRSEEFAKAVKKFYFKEEKVSRRTLNNFIEVISDIAFNDACNEAAEIHSQKQHKSPLYLYRFDYEGSLNLFKNKIFRLKYLKGVCHGDDLFYIFQSTLAPEPWDKEAKKIVQMMCKLWTNFAKHSNPTPTLDRECCDCIWEPLKKADNADNLALNVLLINKQQKMEENPNSERFAFWKNIRATYNS